AKTPRCSVVIRTAFTGRSSLGLCLVHAGATVLVSRLYRPAAAGTPTARHLAAATRSPTTTPGAGRRTRARAREAERTRRDSPARARCRARARDRRRTR